MTSLRVTGLRKGFGGPPVLDGVELVVPEGSFTAILGPSGSGKTTLLRVVAGFDRADAGAVALGDHVVDDAGARFVAPEHRQLGYVPQEGALFPHLSVEANVGFGLPRSRRRGAEVAGLLDMVGLGGLRRRYPHELSGGQQQRVALARALAIRPAMVLLDEPFSSLDAGLRATVRADVQAVLRRAGTTAVLVTHDQDEALSLADQVAVIRGGRIGQADTPHAIYGSPADPALAGFLGDANLIPGVVDGRVVDTPLGRLELAVGEVALRTGERVRVLVRPEQLGLSRQPAGAPLTGEVRGYQYFGHDAVVRVAPAGPGPDQLVVRVDGGVPWAEGDTVGISARGPVRAWPDSVGPGARGERPGGKPADPGAAADDVDVTTPVSSPE